MRTLVEPSPSSHCELCGGELRLELVEAVVLTPEFQKETFTCAACGHEQSFIVVKDEPSGPTQT